MDQLEEWQRDHDHHHEALKATVTRIEHRFNSIDAAIGKAVWLLAGTLLTGVADFIINTLTKVH